MKNVRKLLALLALVSMSTNGLWADVNFGSSAAGFVVANGAELDLNGAVLTDGTLKTIGTGALSFTAPATCLGMTVETRSVENIVTHSATIDGAVDLGTSLTLGTAERLYLDGGEFTTPLIVNGSPSVLQGHGQFSNDIVINGGKQLNMRWSDPLNCNIVKDNVSATASTVKLDQDLSFAPTYRITAETATESVSVDFNGNRMFIGGDESNNTVITHPQSWLNANVVLSGPLEIAASKTVTFSTPSACLNGNGNAIIFNNSSVLSSATDVLLTHVVLSGVTSASLAGAGDWTLSDVTFATSSYSLTVTGSITSATVDILGSGTTTFGASQISLNKDFVLDGTWTFGGASTINGQGNVLDINSGIITLSSGTVSLRDVTLSRVVAASFNADAAQAITLSNVTWMSAANGTIHVDGAAGTTTGAAVTLADSTTSGNIFNTATVAWSSAHISLQSDVVLDTTWSFTENSVLDGNGFHLDLDGGVISVAAGKTLVIRNVVLDNVVDTSLADTTGTVNLSNVTIILGGNVTWGALDTSLVVDGPITIVTGSNTIEVPNAAGTSLINGLTGYYDTLGNADANNVTGFTGTGRMVSLTVYPTLSEELALTAGTSYLNRTEYLAVTASGVTGRVIDCTGAITLDGLGRGLVFPTTPDVVLTVNDTTTVKTKNITFAGLQPAHLSISATDGFLFFGDKTTIALDQDWTLAQTMQFGTANGATNEVMVLDLQGHTINMAHSSALISLQGAAGNVLHIINGRIINMSSTKIAAEASTKIIFDNVELELAGNTTYANADITFEGNCTISGVSGSQFSYTPDAGTLTIATGGSLIIANGITYYHNNEGTENFVMADGSSQLHLIGGTFLRKSTTTTDPLVLTNGVLYVDHKSTINVGTHDINIGNGTFANNLSIEFLPSATLLVQASDSGKLLYNNGTEV